MCPVDKHGRHILSLGREPERDPGWQTGNDKEPEAELASGPMIAARTQPRRAILVAMQRAFIAVFPPRRAPTSLARRVSPDAARRAASLSQAENRRRGRRSSGRS